MACWNDNCIFIVCSVWRRFMPSSSTPVSSTTVSSTSVSSTVISSTQHFAVISHTLLKVNVLWNILAIYIQIYNFLNPTQLLICWVLVRKELSLVFSLLAWTHVLIVGATTPAASSWSQCHLVIVHHMMSVDVPRRNTPQNFNKAMQNLKFNNNAANRSK